MLGVVGEIRGFAGNFAPRAWAFCMGQVIQISTNIALFSIIGTTYGGDGRTTFMLPDLRGRIPISRGTGPGLSPKALGARDGIEEVTMNTLTMAYHTHFSTVSATSPQFKVSNADATDSVPTSRQSAIAAPGSNPGRGFVGTLGFNDATPTVPLHPNSIGITGAAVTLAPTGANQKINNVMPSLCINMVICLQGVYPSRS